MPFLMILGHDVTHALIQPWTVTPEFKVPVKTLAEASKALRAFVDSTGMGGSAMCKDFGLVLDSTGNPFARVSYNGRVWPTAPWFPGQEDLTGDVLTKSLE